MKKLISYVCLLAACLVLAPSSAYGQEVVHGLSGTVISVNPAAKTLQIQTDDGSEGLFTTALKPGVIVDFPKSLQAGTTDAASFTKTKARVLVYYIGYADVRTAIAVKDLGSGPFVKAVGTVVKFSRHDNQLTIKDGSGTPVSFHVDANTVAEGAEGIEEGEKLDAHKGDQVRVIATSANSGETALFVRSM